MTDRMRTLLLAAAEAMEDGRSPFEEAFLIEHSVTLDEVYTLSEQIAASVRLTIDLIVDPSAARDSWPSGLGGVWVPPSTQRQGGGGQTDG